jgi:hypothetical protein
LSRLPGGPHHWPGMEEMLGLVSAPMEGGAGPAAGGPVMESRGQVPLKGVHCRCHGQGISPGLRKARNRRATSPNCNAPARRGASAVASRPRPP